MAQWIQCHCMLITPAAIVVVGYYYLKTILTKDPRFPGSPRFPIRPGEPWKVAKITDSFNFIDRVGVFCNGAFKCYCCYLLVTNNTWEFLMDWTCTATKFLYQNNMQMQYIIIEYNIMNQSKHFLFIFSSPV